MVNVIEQSHEEKMAMYMKLPKKQIIEMLINCNQILESKPTMDVPQDSSKVIALLKGKEATYELWASQKTDKMDEYIDSFNQIKYSIEKLESLNPLCGCPICGESMKGIQLVHYKCKGCNEHFTN